jgi:mannosyl-oligosaccharide glucosidase
MAMLALAMAVLTVLHMQNLVSEYNARGYLYEQYDDASGRGLSSHPFTGWTALLVLIAANAY